MGLPAVQSKADQVQTILVVEDEALLRITLVDHLRSVGYRVAEAGTAEEAVRVLLSSSNIDLVFSDVELPGAMGGFALAVWIRRHICGYQSCSPRVLGQSFHRCVASASCPSLRNRIHPSRRRALSQWFCQSAPHRWRMPISM